MMFIRFILFTKRPASQRDMSFNTCKLLPHEASNKMRQLSYIAGSVGSRIWSRWNHTWDQNIAASVLHILTVIFKI